MAHPKRPRPASAIIDHSSGRLGRAVSLARELGPVEIFNRVRRAGAGGVYDFLSRNLRHQIAHILVRRFDKKWGVDTAGSIQIDDLDVLGPNRASGNEAVSTSPRSFNWLLDRTPLPQEGTFIDIGCGKGRTVLLASERFPLAVGVEFARELVDIARQNARTYARSPRSTGQMHIIRKDAADFRFPEGPLVVYFYNPFSEQLFRRVIANLERSIAESPRPCTIIYTTGMGTLDWAAEVLRNTHGFAEVESGRTPGFRDAIRRMEFAIFRTA